MPLLINTPHSLKYILLNVLAYTRFHIWDSVWRIKSANIRAIWKGSRLRVSVSIYHRTHRRKAAIHLEANLSAATPQSMLPTESCSIFSCLHCRISMSDAWCNRSVRIHLLQTQTHPQLSGGFISYSRSCCVFFWLMSEASWNNMFWFWKQIFFFFSYITRWLIRDKWSSLWHPTNWVRAFQHRGFYSGKFKTRAMSLWRGSKGLLKLTLSWGSREIATKKLQEQSHSVDSGSAF